MGGELAVILARRCPECDLVNKSPWAAAIRASHAGGGSGAGGPGDPHPLAYEDALPVHTAGPSLLRVGRRAQPPPSQKNS